MKTCLKIKEEKAVWRKKRGNEGGGRRAAVGTALAPLTLSNCSLSFCFQKTTGVPQSLGTAVSQILVLNDVRNMAFWRATASTQLWRPSLRLTLAMRLQAQKHGTVSHWHLSIRRDGGKKILYVLTVDPLRQLILLLLIPYCLGLWRKYVFLKWEIGHI